MGGGGVSGAQKNAAAGQLSGIGSTAAGNMGTQQQAATAAAQPATAFYANQMRTGLPFYRNLTDYSGGNIARAYAPQYGAVMRSTSGYGTNTPSGYRDALMNNLRGQQAGAFDQQLTQAQMANQMAKQQGAAGLTGEQQIAQNAALGYGGLGAGANQAILQAPQKPSIWGTLAGAGLGAAQAFAGV